MKYFSNLKMRFEVEGYGSEQALSRLKKEGVSLFFVRRKDKKTILFCVKNKDFQKAFTFLGGMWYNNTEQKGKKGQSEIAREKTKPPSGVTIREVKPVGLNALLKKRKQLLCFLAGLLLFLSGVFLSKNFILSVRVTGEEEQVFAASELLIQEGVKDFCFYQEEKIPALTAKLLSLEKVSYVSFSKEGYLLTVSLFPAKEERVLPQEDVYSPVSGRILSIKALSGEPQKAVGEQVKEGELLIRAKTQSASGERDALVIAEVKILKEEEKFFPAKEEALLFGECLLQKKRGSYLITASGEGFLLKSNLEETYRYGVEQGGKE